MSASSSGSSRFSTSSGPRSPQKRRASRSRRGRSPRSMYCGRSSCMVEMQETANILHSATSRSFVVLDEIGRGTATFDGLSIAWAVAEFLATNPRVRPKTLFATHYHELTDLADATPGVVNFHVAAREWKDDIVFLRKILPGRSDRSYGIQVARLAGLPRQVICPPPHIPVPLAPHPPTRG